ncbi:MAG: hypothetical protein AAF990_24210 [Bacteroidota bacterium]
MPNSPRADVANELWAGVLNVLGQTSLKAPYGFPAIARAIGLLGGDPQAGLSKVCV